jgi:hypothetical protein
VAWLLQSSKTLRNAGPHSVVGLLFSFQRPNFSHHRTSTPTPLALPRFPRGPEDLLRSRVAASTASLTGGSSCFSKELRCTSFDQPSRPAPRREGAVHTSGALPGQEFFDKRFEFDEFESD